MEINSSSTHTKYHSKKIETQPSILEALKLRQLGQIDDFRFRSVLTTTLVPRNVFLDVKGVPDVNFRRFTPCGKYLIAMKDHGASVVVYRFETGGRRQLTSRGISNNADATVPSSDIDFTVSAISDRDLPQPIRQPIYPRNPASEFITTNYLNSNYDPVQNFTAVPTYRSFAVADAPRGLLESITLPLAPVPVYTTQNNTSQQPNPLEDHPTCHFNRFFTKMYQFSIDQTDDDLISNFCIVTHTCRYMLLLSVHQRIVARENERNNNTTDDVHAITIPIYYQRITFHLVDIETGETKDRYHLYNDLIHLDDHGGVYLYHSTFCILALRHQALHILSIQENTGRLLLERIIGTTCESDDDLEIARVQADEERYQARQRQNSQSTETNIPPIKRIRMSHENEEEQGNRSRLPRRRSIAEDRNFNSNLQNRANRNRSRDSGLGNGRMDTGFLTGLMHRLLVFVHRKMESEGRTPNFFRVVDQFSSLVMQKAQLLDDDHLLIKLGSNPDWHVSPRPGACFFCIYCISEAKIEELFDNQSTRIFEIFDSHRGLHLMSEAEAAMFPPIRTSPSPQETRQNGSLMNSLNRNMLRRTRNPFTSRSLETLFELPAPCQVRNISPYLDRRIFSYLPQKQSPLYGTRSHLLRFSYFKFSSVQGHKLRFKLGPSSVRQRLLRKDPNTGPGSRAWSQEEVKIQRTRTRFLFHPIYPFVITIETSRNPTQVLTFNLYGHDRPRLHDKETN